MVTEEKYSGYFGFMESEVDELYKRYLKQDIMERKVTRDGLRNWYDGYHIKAGERVYNPRSVVLALTGQAQDPMMSCFTILAPTWTA